MPIVLCPSIALVAQIRREYLQNAAVPVDILAVCSDQTAGYDPKKESSRNSAADPTVDNSNVSESEVKGRVTTDADEIAAWIKQSSADETAIKVLIGTYQSSHRVSDALLKSGVKARVLIADEAHRTAGLKRKKSKSAAANAEERRLRDFTVCHEQARFPVTYRVYQTATPRIYSGKPTTGNPDWIVRSMDDETTFGVELYRKSYLEAVRNEWLADYRIIAMGINDHTAYEQANILAQNTKSKGRRKLTTTDYLRGLAFALTMGGATQGPTSEGDVVDIESCIAFMNTVDKSKNMAEDLANDRVKEWVADWLENNAPERRVTKYTLEHLDASSNAAAREQAKVRLATAGKQKPHGIINVGIFGEGTDSPSLSAVAFLEARKSPIDVVQAVGRAMRTAPGKQMGYIICPILIPPTADPETWLSTSDMNEGWEELGQILLALRAHDQRIEENLQDLMQLYIPTAPPAVQTVIATADPERKNIRWGMHTGPVGEAERAVDQVIDGANRDEVGIKPLSELPDPSDEVSPETDGNLLGDDPATYGDGAQERTPSPTQIVTGKKTEDGARSCASHRWFAINRSRARRAAKSTSTRHKKRPAR